MDRIPGGWYSATAEGLCNPWIPIVWLQGEFGRDKRERRPAEVWVSLGLKCPPGPPGRPPVSNVIPPELQRDSVIHWPIMKGANRC